MLICFQFSWVWAYIFLYPHHPAHFKARGRYQLTDCKLKATLVSEKSSLSYIKGATWTLERIVALLCLGIVISSYSFFQVVSNHVLFHIVVGVGSSTLLTRLEKMSSEVTMKGHGLTITKWNILETANFFGGGGETQQEIKHIPLILPWWGHQRRTVLVRSPGLCFVPPTIVMETQ